MSHTVKHSHALLNLLQLLSAPVLMALWITFATWPWRRELSSLTRSSRQVQRTTMEPARRIRPTERSESPVDTNRCLPVEWEDRRSSRHGHLKRTVIHNEQYWKLKILKFTSQNYSFVQLSSCRASPYVLSSWLDMLLSVFWEDLGKEITSLPFQMLCIGFLNILNYNLSDLYKLLFFVRDHS